MIQYRYLQGHNDEMRRAARAKKTSEWPSVGPEKILWIGAYISPGTRSTASLKRRSVTSHTKIVEP